MDNRKIVSINSGHIVNRKIILASQSPRRRQLLEWAEIDFEVIVASTDESYPPDLSINEIPVYIAKQKAFEVKNLSQATGAIVIAADTVVVADGKIIGKPQSAQNAFEILSGLSGRSHQVITGVCLSGRIEVCFADVTDVEFHHLTEDEIWFYIDKYKPYDKAGAYGIQEWIGVTGIKSIHGDFYNVMGLPVSRVLHVLKTGDL